MPRSEPSLTSHPSRGFTLVEVVMVIAVTGVLFAVVGRFIVQPIQGYLATVARAELVDTADLSLRRIGRDLAIALPNSVRVTASGLGLELIPTTGAARYATDSGDPLSFGTIDTSFDIIGPPLSVTASQELVFYNLGPNVTGSNAYADNSSAAAQARSSGGAGRGGAATGAASAV
jgi:MSHA biogenesis protein MshO